MGVVRGRAKGQGPGLRVLWAAGAVFVLACGREPPPARSDDSPVRTDSTAFWTDSVVYHLVRDERGWGARIGYRFRNLAADTVYAVNCNGATSVAVERRVGDGWVTFWAPMLNMCLSPPIAIPPGEVLDAPLSLWGAPPGGNVGPEYSDTTFTGRYRLNWWNLVFHYDPDSPGFGDTVPLKYRVSNEFELRLRR